MNKSMILSLALGAATLAGFGGATSAVAQSGYRSDNSWGRGRQIHARDIVGVWQIDERRGAGWNGRLGSDFRTQNMGAVRLPNVIQIERGRRELRVENQNGRLIRRIEMGRRGDWNGNRFEVASTVRGMRVTETFMLQSGGRELVVRTVVQGPRGQRQFTSVYDRA